jgi:hypothetical protein
MGDLIALLVLLVLFPLSVAYVAGCQRLKSGKAGTGTT